LICLKNDVVSLARLDPEGIGLIWDNGSEIGADDLDLVAIKSDGVGTLGGTEISLAKSIRTRIEGLPVDDAEQVLLALLDNPSAGFTCGSIWRGVLSVEEVVSSGR
jgi:hypothetical protein